MNKQEFVEAIAKDAKISQIDSGRILNSVLNTIIRAMKKGDEVVITGFGKFGVRRRAAQSKINPKTKEPVKVPAKNVPTFKAGKGLKDAIN